MQTQYRETKTCFECIYLPSTSLPSSRTPTSARARRQHCEDATVNKNRASLADPARPIRCSKIIKGSAAGRRRTRGRTGEGASRSTFSWGSSFLDISSNVHTITANEPLQQQQELTATTTSQFEEVPTRSQSPTAGKTLPLPGPDAYIARSYAYGRGG